MLSRFYVHCVGYHPVSMSIVSDVIRCFLEKIPFPVFFHPQKFAYIKKLLYLCARICKMVNCVNIVDKIFVLCDTINRQIKPWQI